MSRSLPQGVRTLLLPDNNWYESAFTPMRAPAGAAYMISGQSVTTPTTYMYGCYKTTDIDSAGPFLLTI